VGEEAMSELKNPWTTLRDKEFVFNDDLRLIREHNAKCKSSDHKINLNVFPEPFIGNPNAPLWLLNLNPGFVKKDLRHTPETIAMQKRSAALKADDFWYLDERYKSAAGHGWWTQKLGELIDGYTVDQVKKNVFCVELFPYHSKKWRSTTKSLLPSQQFTLELVKHAVAEGKKFIIMRQFLNWLRLVKDLERARYTCLRSPQNGAISRRNLKDPSILADVFGEP
jgi:hypothetical protein